MELASQIKKYRRALSLSQEELAEKIYVSRQSVSNWETGKTYPDLKSLLMLCSLFSVSLDTLVKGDLKIMKREISAADRSAFQRDSRVFTVLFFLVLALPIPLAKWMGWWGLAVDLALFVFTMYFALRVEKHKKQFDIQTYREILAFSEGRTLDEIEKARESGKRPYQKFLLAAGSGLLAGLIAAGLTLLLK